LNLRDPESPIRHVRTGLLATRGGILIGWASLLIGCAGLLNGCASRGTHVPPAQPATQPAPVVNVPAPDATGAGAPQAAAAAEPVQAPRAPTILQGSGTFVAPPSEATPPPPPSGEGFQLSFSDVDIATVAAAVLGDGLGVPYTVDPQLKAKMTLQATRPLTQDELLPTLEAALRVHGAAVVVTNGIYNVVPIKEAARHVTNFISRPGSGFGIQIVSPQYVAASELERLLQPFAPEGGVLRVDEARNLLLLAGTGQEIATMLEVIKTFDVDWLAGLSFGLYPLEYVDARTIASELEAVFGDEKGPLAGMVRLTPLGRLNSLMVVTPQPRYLAQVESWIKRLDVGNATPGRRIYVYDVQNGKADELAASLSKILDIAYEATSTSSGSSPGGSFGGSMSGSLGGGAGLDGGGLGGASNVTARRVSNLDVTNSGNSGGGGQGSNSVRIVPSPENNALLINASPSEYTVIESALKRLDVRPIQVLIEASLAEVTLTDDLRYGLQWSYTAGDGTMVYSEASNGSVSPQFPGFSYLFTGRADIRAVLNAIESLTDVKVISSPKLMVLNNREAQLQIGDQVPVTVQSSVGTVGDNSPIVNSVQFRDTGVILRVTPRVNKSGLVTLDVSQEVSDVVPTTTSGIDSPTIQQRKFNTTVAVRNGETVALGGLIRDNKSRSRSGIPGLRRIPIIGDLFGSTDKQARRTELIVLMTPRVIQTEQDSQELLEKLQRDFRGLHQVAPEWGVHATTPPPPPQ
jgi:general secretion pathway protein D